MKNSLVLQMTQRSHLLTDYFSFSLIIISISLNTWGLGVLGFWGSKFFLRQSRRTTHPSDLFHRETPLKKSNGCVVLRTLNRRKISRVYNQIHFR